MSRDFPELTTIGALFRFARVLEELAIEVLDAAAEKAGGDGEELRKLSTKHRRRAEELELARREKLNETVLEPLMDMPNSSYLPRLPADLASADGATLRAAALEVESKAALFYGDAVDKAGTVLAEVRRLFARFQKESAKNQRSLG